MSIEQAEQLKREWTDKFVVVNPDVPHLRRFRTLTGTVKTVNMNCRALVQFDGPEDISWYDIDLEHLQIVDAPLPKKKAPAAAEGEKAVPKKKAPAKTGGKSPLELARQQGAGGKASEDKPAGKKLSPLEQARQQGAGGKSSEDKPAGKKLSPLEHARQQGAAGGKSSEDKPAQKPAGEDKPAGKKLSPLEMARQQGAAKQEGESEPGEPATADTAASSKPNSSPSGKKLSPLELARRQDAKKND